jgi:hypothetical protein
MSSKPTPEARADYWRQQIETWQSSGQSQQAYCKANGLNYGRFLYWRRKFREIRAHQAHKPSPAFVPVAWPMGASTSGLSVVLPSGLELRGVSTDNLPLVERLLDHLS